MTFEDDLAAQVVKPRPSQDVDVLINGTPYTFRFVQIDGFEWAAECDKHPARPGVLLDTRYGYNLRSLTKAVARLSGTRVDGDKLIPLRVDKVDPKAAVVGVDEWASLFKNIDGAAFQRISDAIWALNEYAPANAIEAAKKALKGSVKASA